MMEKTKSAFSMEFLQGLGKTFMLPVALLAFMGLFLGLGSALSSEAIITTLPFLGNHYLQLLFRFFSTIGSFAFSFLPELFAIAIPLGLVRYEKGVAAFSGFVGYVVMNLSINFVLVESNQIVEENMIAEAGQDMVMGIQTLQMGVLGGIIAGITVYQLHKNFYNIQLNEAFGFFSGVRFVPIISSVVLAIIGLFIPVIWPLFSQLINGVGNLIQNSGFFGPFLFGASERLLLPTGLHHILVSTIRFTEAGGTQIVNGNIVSGALNIFYAQLQSGEAISETATAFLSQGKMPTFMFGLPAAALAMYHSADPDKRNKIKGLLLSGVIATFVTGITEPIEFLFLFIAPILFVFHIVMTGLGFMLMYILGVTIGNTDGGILDFIIFGVLQGIETRWYFVILVGLLWFVIYYFTFRIAIKKLNLQTPGRSNLSIDNRAKNTKEYERKKKELKFNTVAILEALGGKENIQDLDNCVTRLRIVVHDMEKINENKLTSNGALGVFKLDKHNIQVVIGTRVGTLKSELEKIIG